MNAYLIITNPIEQSWKEKLIDYLNDVRTGMHNYGKVFTTVHTLKLPPKIVHKRNRNV